MEIQRNAFYFPFPLLRIKEWILRILSGMNKNLFLSMSGGGGSEAAVRGESRGCLEKGLSHHKRDGKMGLSSSASLGILHLHEEIENQVCVYKCIMMMRDKGRGRKSNGSSSIAILLIGS